MCLNHLIPRTFCFKTIRYFIYEYKESRDWEAAGFSLYEQYVIHLQFGWLRTTWDTSQLADSPLREVLGPIWGARCGIYCSVLHFRWRFLQLLTCNQEEIHRSPHNTINDWPTLNRYEVKSVARSKDVEKVKVGLKK